LLAGDFVGYVERSSRLFVSGDSCEVTCPKGAEQLINTLIQMGLQALPEALIATVIDAIVNPVDLRPQLPQIQIPVLCIGGQNDRDVFSNNAIAAMLNGLPNARAIVFPQKSHAVIATETCAFNEVLLDFL